MANRVFMIRMWRPFIEAYVDHLQSIPIWVSFRKIPSHLKTHEGIGTIASVVGIPLYFDKPTEEMSRKNYARVCIEVEVKNMLPRRVPVNIDGIRTIQVEAEYGWVPVKCDHCQVFGHSNYNCAFREKQNETKKHTGKRQVNNNKQWITVPEKKNKTTIDEEGFITPKQKGRSFIMNGETCTKTNARGEGARKVPDRPEGQQSIHETGITSGHKDEQGGIMESQPCTTQSEESPNSTSTKTGEVSKNGMRNKAKRDKKKAKKQRKEEKDVKDEISNVAPSKEKYRNSNSDSEHEKGGREWMVNTGLDDLKFKGWKYTWINKAKGDDRIISKLDRALVNKKWVDAFKGAKAEFINYDTLETVWRERVYGNPMERLYKKLYNTKMGLKDWSKNKNSGLSGLVSELKESLDKAQDALLISPMDGNVVQKDEEALDSYVKIAQKEEQMLKQISRVKWMEGGGDLNTAYYHRAIQARRSINTIMSIQDEHNNTIYDPKVASKAAVEYFTSIIGGGCMEIDRDVILLLDFKSKVSNDSHANLIREVTNEEIRDVMFDINENRAPGPDGFN
ncbi:hypothetical protein GIB67_006043 [Kingdonia uniflora]|uniref:DUF4283 domain-containing protein n=1 Tax=Kingdonia uniflora TaxID=39325 RepID=A0A7J7LPE9_9MAGN|nr:hypothetical protein GIB67_006043 [Kingdonia uniflora]